MADESLLLEIIKEQQRQIGLLTAALIRREGLAYEDTKIIVPEAAASGMGKVPWNVLKGQLEMKHAAKKGSQGSSNDADDPSKSGEGDLGEPIDSESIKRVHLQDAFG